jgi:Chalcone isomerase-like
MKALAIPLLLTLLAAVSVFAGEMAGVKLPDRITVDGKTLVLNGMGLREATFLKVDVYVAGLYLEEKTSDPSRILDTRETRRLVLKFVRGVSQREMTKAWSEGFEKSAGKGLPSMKDRIATLNSWMSDLDKGDTLVFTEIPARGVAVEVKGEARGEIPGDDFARALWGIWLGPSPPNPGLRKGLLGL